jgi:hypothetical protein
MPTIFSAILPDEIKITAENVQALLDSYRERQKTGVVRLGYAFEKQLYFLFKRGDAINAYLITPEKWEAMSPEHSADWILSAGDAYAKSISLSSLGLLTTKLLIQSGGASTKVFDSQTQLANHLAAFESGGEAALVRLEWKNAAGLVFFSPLCKPHFSFASQDVLLDESGGYKALCEWNESQCEATVFPPDLSVEAWQEYYLRNSFKSICETSFSRFETLTGRALVDSLARLVNVFTSRQNMEISITARKLTDDEVFSSPSKALYTYRFLMAELFEHFSGVIGPRLYVSTLREVAKNLPRHELEITRNFELLPKGYLNE